MKHIVRGIENGGSRSLAELGITGEITQVWTILDEDRLFTQFDSMTGERITVELQAVNPVHHHSAFAEDRLHDWNVRGGRFYLHTHSAERNKVCDVLIVTA